MYSPLIVETPELCHKKWLDFYLKLSRSISVNHQHPCPAIFIKEFPTSLGPSEFPKPFWHWFLKSTHGSDVEDRSGQSLQPPPSAQNYTTTLARELYSVFTARLSVELGAAKCLQNTNKCVDGVVVALEIKPFFLVKIRGLFTPKFLGCLSKDIAGS